MNFDRSLKVDRAHCHSLYCLLLLAALLSGCAPAPSPRPEPLDSQVEKSSTEPPHSATLDPSAIRSATWQQGLQQRLLHAAMEEGAWEYLRLYGETPDSPLDLTARRFLALAPINAAGQATSQLLLNPGQLPATTDSWVAWRTVDQGWAWDSYTIGIDEAARGNSVIDLASLTQKRDRLISKGRWIPIEAASTQQSEPPASPTGDYGFGSLDASADAADHRLLTWHHLLRLMVWHYYRSTQSLPAELDDILDATGLAPLHALLTSDAAPLQAPGILLEIDSNALKLRLSLQSESGGPYVTEYQIAPHSVGEKSDWRLDPVRTENLTPYGAPGNYTRVARLQLVE